MAMDSETFTRNMAVIGNKVSTGIKNNLVEFFVSNQQDITEGIIRIIQKYIPDFMEERIVDILNEAYQNIINAQSETSKSLSDKVNTITNRAIKMRLESGMSIERVSSATSTRLHELEMDNNFNKIDKYFEEMIKDIVNFLERKEQIPSNMNQSEFYDLMLKIRVDLLEYIAKIIPKIKEKGGELVSQTLEGYAGSIASKIEEYISSFGLNSNREEKDMRLSFAGYELAVDINGLKLVNKITHAEHELMKRDEGSYTTIDNSIVITEGVRTKIINREENTSLIIDDSTISIGTPSSPEDIKVEFSNSSFEFYYKDKLETDLIKKGIIMETIKEKCPGIFNSFQEYIGFNSEYEEAYNAKNKEEKLYSDENGIVRINPSNEDSLVQSANILGYQVEEREDGVYFEKEGKSYKVKFENGTISFENHKVIRIEMDYYIVGQKSIAGPIIRFSDSFQNISYMASFDFAHMSLFIGDFSYFINQRKNGEVSYVIKNRDGVVDSPDNQKLVEEAYNEYMPNALLYFKQKYTQEKEPTKALELLDELEEKQQFPEPTPAPTPMPIDQVQFEQDRSVDALIAELSDDLSIEDMILNPDIVQKRTGGEDTIASETTHLRAM